MGQLIVRITKRHTAEVLAEIKVPMTKGVDFARTAKSAAIRAWRRDTGDWHTSIDTRIIPAEEATL